MRYAQICFPCVSAEWKTRITVPELTVKEFVNKTGYFMSQMYYKRLSDRVQFLCFLFWCCRPKRAWRDLPRFYSDERIYLLGGLRISQSWAPLLLWKNTRISIFYKMLSVVLNLCPLYGCMTIFEVLFLPVGILHTQTILLLYVLFLCLLPLVTLFRHFLPHR